jgi:hypothetical protein
MENSNSRLSLNLDVRNLLEQAQRAEDGEAFKELERTENYRIGVGARALPPKNTTGIFFELLVPLLTGPAVDLDLIEGGLQLMRKLSERGYRLSLLDGNCVACEARIEIDRVEAELKAVKELANKAFSPKMEK